MKFNLILAENAVEARAYAAKHGFGFSWAYVSSPGTVMGMKPKFSEVHFALNWWRNEKSSILFRHLLDRGFLHDQSV